MFCQTLSEALILPIIPASEPSKTWTDRTVGFSSAVLDRMESAVAKVRERLLRAASALHRVGIPFAVCGGNAVASWVATVDEGAVRNTRDIDLLVRRSDLDSIKTILGQAGYFSEMVQMESQARGFTCCSRVKRLALNIFFRRLRLPPWMIRQSFLSSHWNRWSR